MNSEIRFLKKYVLPVSIVVVMAALLFSGVAAHAAVVLESGIPGVGEGGRQGAELPGLATYINYLYIFVLSFVGIAGFISIVIWGAVWVSSAVVDQKTRALEGIKNTLIGIGIALTAFIMLYTINPDLTVIKIPKIEEIKDISSGIECSKYSVDICPSPACIITTSGCKSNQSMLGACLVEKYTSTASLTEAAATIGGLYKSCTDGNTIVSCAEKASTKDTLLLIGDACDQHCQKEWEVGWGVFSLSSSGCYGYSEKKK